MTKFLDIVREKKKSELIVLNDKYKSEISNFSNQNKKDQAFISALKKEVGSSIKLISEIKPWSPSTKNLAVSDVNKIKLLAGQYIEGGSSALSILTDHEYFGGSYEYIREIRNLYQIPILQKEFIIDPLQLIIGKLMGANAALILTYYFSKQELQEIINIAYSIGIEPVVECSIPEELDTALSCDFRVLLLNNRPISLLPENPTSTYLSGSVENAGKFWNEYAEVRKFKERAENILISASCVSNKSDVNQISAYRYDAVLVGNAASSNISPAKFIASLIEI